MRSLSLAEEVLSLASARLKAGCPHSKRTGIVSPEGILLHPQTAHRDLRDLGEN